MSSRYVIVSAPSFERQLKRLARHHPDLPDRLAEAMAVLRNDPANASRRYPVRKLTAVSPGEGQYRIRSGRFRIRYDISGRTVELLHCGLRREDTYR